MRRQLSKRSDLLNVPANPPYYPEVFRCVPSTTQVTLSERAPSSCGLFEAHAIQHEVIEPIGWIRKPYPWLSVAGLVITVSEVYVFEYLFGRIFPQPYPVDMRACLA